MGKVIEFENVYLEYPDELEMKVEEQEVLDELAEEEKEAALTRTQKFSVEELQKKLEETQSLHL